MAVSSVDVSGSILDNDDLDFLIIRSAGGSPLVTSVFGNTGAIVAATSDYDAVQVDNAIAGGISATNVQAAIDELDTEKLTDPFPGSTFNKCLRTDGSGNIVEAGADCSTPVSQTADETEATAFSPTFYGDVTGDSLSDPPGISCTTSNSVECHLRGIDVAIGRALQVDADNDGIPEMFVRDDGDYQCLVYNPTDVDVVAVPTAHTKADCVKAPGKCQGTCLLGVDPIVDMSHNADILSGRGFMSFSGPYNNWQIDRALWSDKGLIVTDSVGPVANRWMWKVWLIQNKHHGNINEELPEVILNFSNQGRLRLDEPIVIEGRTSRIQLHGEVLIDSWDPITYNAGTVRVADAADPTWDGGTVVSENEATTNWCGNNPSICDGARALHYTNVLCDDTSVTGCVNQHGQYKFNSGAYFWLDADGDCRLDRDDPLDGNMSITEVQSLRRIAGIGRGDGTNPEILKLDHPLWGFEGQMGLKYCVANASAIVISQVADNVILEGNLTISVQDEARNHFTNQYRDACVHSVTGTFNHDEHITWGAGDGGYIIKHVAADPLALCKVCSHDGTIGCTTDVDCGGGNFCNVNGDRIQYRQTRNISGGILAIPSVTWAPATVMVDVATGAKNAALIAHRDNGDLDATRTAPLWLIKIHGGPTALLNQISSLGLDGPDDHGEGAVLMQGSTFGQTLGGQHTIAYAAGAQYLAFYGLNPDSTHDNGKGSQWITLRGGTRVVPHTYAQPMPWPLGVFQGRNTSGTYVDVRAMGEGWGAGIYAPLGLYDGDVNLNCEEAGSGAAGGTSSIFDDARVLPTDPNDYTTGGLMPWITIGPDPEGGGQGDNNARVNGGVCNFFGRPRPYLHLDSSTGGSLLVTGGAREPSRLIDIPGVSRNGEAIDVTLMGDLVAYQCNSGMNRANGYQDEYSCVWDQDANGQLDMCTSQTGEPMTCAEYGDREIVLDFGNQARILDNDSIGLDPNNPLIHDCSECPAGVLCIMDVQTDPNAPNLEDDWEFCNGPIELGDVGGWISTGDVDVDAAQTGNLKPTDINRYAQLIIGTLKADSAQATANNAVLFADGDLAKVELFEGLNNAADPNAANYTAPPATSLRINGLINDPNSSTFGVVGLPIGIDEVNDNLVLGHTDPADDFQCGGQTGMCINFANGSIRLPKVGNNGLTMLDPQIASIALDADATLKIEERLRSTCFARQQVQDETVPATILSDNRLYHHIIREDVAYTVEKAWCVTDVGTAAFQPILHSTHLQMETNGVPCSTTPNEIAITNANRAVVADGSTDVQIGGPAGGVNVVYGCIYWSID